MRNLPLFCVAALFVSCANTETYVPQWVETGKEINENYADVFWIPGTLVMNVQDDEGNPEYLISQTPEQQALFTKAALSSRDSIFPDSLNFFSPLYHQFTLQSIYLPAEAMDSLINIVSNETYAAFHYYMENLNNGRPYVLAGMSQGAMMVRGILKKMTDEEYSRMAAAYSLGFGLSAEDLTYSHIKAAEGEFDKGVTISYNSAVSPDGIWPLVRNDAKAIINPVNWKTDATPATFISGEDTVTVHIDTLYNILMVSGLHPTDLSSFPIDEPWVKDNLHFADVSLYNTFLRKNVLDRIYR